MTEREVKAYSEQIQRNPKDATAYNNRGVCYAQIAKFEGGKFWEVREGEHEQLLFSKKAEVRRSAVQKAEAVEAKKRRRRMEADGVFAFCGGPSVARSTR
jgi:hypothetical protein